MRRTQAKRAAQLKRFSFHLYLLNVHESHTVTRTEGGKRPENVQNNADSFSSLSTGCLFHSGNDVKYTVPATLH